MALRAVKFEWRGHEEVPFQAELDTQSGPGLNAQLRSGALPAAWVVQNRDLARLREFRDTIIDRGRKHETKSLGQIVMDQKSIPLVEGSYTHVGQLIRSVRTLLDNATRNHDDNA